MSLVDKKTGLLDKEKMKNLESETRSEMVYFIVRNRQAIVEDLIPNNFDMSWLAAMGYLYITDGKYFTLIHTQEQRIK